MTNSLILADSLVKTRITIFIQNKIFFPINIVIRHSKTKKLPSPGTKILGCLGEHMGNNN